MTTCNSYTWHGTTYRSSGNYIFDTLNAKGCDSITTLNLTINQPTTSTSFVTINIGDSVLFNGNYYSIQGTYVSYLTNVAGCDSSAYLILTVNTSFAISGRVLNPLGAVIPTVTVGLSDGTSTITDVNGNFGFTGTPGIDYTIEAFKNNDVVKTNGITVLDALLVQGHILDKFILNSPYKIIAADVDHSGDVSVLDIIYIKRFILGIDNSFTGNRMWAFVDSSYQFANTASPFPYAKIIGIPEISSNQTTKNFIGVKLGDVNYDWDNTVANVSNTVNKSIELYYNNINANDAAEIRVTVRVKNFKDILGMQYTMNYNSNVLELKSIENCSLAIEYGINQTNKGKVSFLWTDANSEAKSLADGDVLMELVFTKKATIATEDITLSSDIASVEAWNAAYTKVNIVKTSGRIAGSVINAINNENWNVSPNPSNGLVKANLSLTQDKDIQFELTTQDGKVMMVKKVSVAKGNTSNTLNLQQQTKLAAGVYYLKAIGVDGENAKRIIIK